MKKSLFLALTLILSAQIVFAGEVGKSRNPLLTAKKVEVYPENNLMIIHEPRYQYKGEQLNVLASVRSENMDVVARICKAFNATSGNSSDPKFYNFYSYFKKGVSIRADGSMSGLEDQTNDEAPIKSLECYFES